MKFIDLSHPISNSTPVYPGMPAPEIRNLFTIEQHGFREKFLGLVSHTGTHLDAPAHIIPSGRTLEELPLSAFYGKAIVIDVSDRGATAIDQAVLNIIPDNDKPDFVLLHTGWSAKWGNADYLASFPYPSVGLAQKIVDLGLKGVGMDVISIDAIDSKDLPAHHILLSNNILIIENMTNLQQLIGQSFYLAAFPLKIANGDGCPVRAAALI